MPMNGYILSYPSDTVCISVFFWMPHSDTTSRSRSSSGSTSSW